MTKTRTRKAAKIEIVETYGETPVSEWTEWNVYRNGKLVRSCQTEREAKALARKLKAA